MVKPAKPFQSLVRRSAIAATVALALVGPAQADYINDGSFETLHLVGGPYIYQGSAGFVASPGVTYANNSGIAQSSFSGATPPAGTQYAFLQSGGGADHVSPSSITFDVSGLIDQALYSVSFYASLRPGYPANPIQVQFGSTVLALPFVPLSSQEFQLFTTSFTATGTTGSLEFLGLGTGGDVDSALDDIVITLAGDPPGIPVPPSDPSAGGTVPEPAPIALLGLGILGGVFARRRASAARPA